MIDRRQLLYAGASCFGFAAARCATSSPSAAIPAAGEDVPPVSADERAAHVEKVQVGLQAAGIDALVVEPGPTMLYLSGVSWWPSERAFLSIVPARGELAWIAPAFEEARARERAGSGAAMHLWQEHEDPYLLLSAAAPGAGAVAVDPSMREMMADGVRRGIAPRTVVSGREVIRNARMIKTERELMRLERANVITKQCLSRVPAQLREGMMERELHDWIVGAQVAAGLNDVWAIVLFGPNAAFPHGTGQGRRLENGDLVLIDTGGDLHGYCSDITRTFGFGRVGDEARRAFDTVLAAQTAAFEQLRPGVPCERADAAARKVIEAAGFGAGYTSFTHRLGHGIGLEGHEDPYLVMGNRLELRAGMTMSNEPGIYLAGRLGVRIEDIVAITEDGHRVFGPRVERDQVLGV